MYNSQRDKSKESFGSLNSPRIHNQSNSACEVNRDDYGEENQYYEDDDDHIHKLRLNYR